MQRPRATFANVVSCLALFVALGGTGYAAVSLPRNSVGPKQLQPHSIDNSKIKKGSLLKSAFKKGQLPRGLRGKAGAAGAAGPQGASFTLATTLPSGQTEYGDYGVYGLGGGLVGGVVGFRIPLAQGIAAANAHFVAAQQFTPECPAFKQAARGQSLRVPDERDQYDARRRFRDDGMNVAGSSNVGFQVYFTAPGAGPANSFGEWAVTAP